MACSLLHRVPWFGFRNNGRTKLKLKGRGPTAHIFRIDTAAAYHTIGCTPSSTRSTFEAGREKERAARVTRALLFPLSRTGRFDALLDGFASAPAVATKVYSAFELQQNRMKWDDNDAPSERSLHCFVAFVRVEERG